MHDATRSVKANIDYPQEKETVSSPHYTFRIKAPLNAEKVEVCVDGAPWQLCRYASGYWWYDWSGYASGEHELTCRILPFDSRSHILRTRRFQADLESSGRPQPGKPVLTQYSILTSNEPWMLAKVTELLSQEEVAIKGVMTVNVGDTSAIQFLADDDEGLRRKLENAGLPVHQKEVFHLEIPNRPEELNKLARDLAEKEISVRSLYGTVDGPNVKLVLAVDQPESAAPLVAQLAA